MEPKPTGWRLCGRDRERHRGDSGVRPRGVLMLGVQGAGKSLAAKAVATAWQRPLLRMDVGALYDRYIGESERRLRDALQQAERMAPVVLWIDEIEKAFASAASQSTDGGLSKRMFGSLLTWMQERDRPGFPDRHRQRHRGAAAGAAAQGAVRRDLLRRPARPGSADADRRRSTCRSEARPGQVRHRGHRRGVGRLQRRRDRAGDHRRPVRRLRRQRGVDDRARPGGAQGVRRRCR